MSLADPTQPCAKLFSGLTAFFSPLIPPSTRALFCFHGGQLAGPDDADLINLIVGIHGRHDELVERLRALDFEVIDHAWLQDSVRAGRRVDLAAYRFDVLDHDDRLAPPVSSRDAAGSSTLSTVLSGRSMQATNDVDRPRVHFLDDKRDRLHPNPVRVGSVGLDTPRSAIDLARTRHPDLTCSTVPTTTPSPIEAAPRAPASPDRPVSIDDLGAAPLAAPAVTFSAPCPPRLERSLDEPACQGDRGARFLDVQLPSVIAKGTNRSSITREGDRAAEEVVVEISRCVLAALASPPGLAPRLTAPSPSGSMHYSEPPSEAGPADLEHAAPANPSLPSEHRRLETRSLSPSKAMSAHGIAQRAGDGDLGPSPAAASFFDSLSSARRSPPNGEDAPTIDTCDLNDAFASFLLTRDLDDSLDSTTLRAGLAVMRHRENGFSVSRRKDQRGAE